MKELLGAGLAVGSALLYDVGYVVEKRALVSLPPVKASPAGVLRIARSSPAWVGGFVTMLGGLLLQALALTLAPVSVVQPIMAGGLIALAAAGSAVLGERLDARHRLSLALVLGGVLAVTLSARVSTHLAVRVPTVPVVIAAAATSAVALLVRAGGGRRPALSLVSAAVAAGLLYGVGAVADKAVAAVLTRRGLVAGAGHALLGPFPWIFVAATVIGMAVFQSGLQAHPASLMASLTNVTSTIVALAGAGALFGETLLPAGWAAVLRVAGLMAVVAAVVLLARPAMAEVGTAGRPDRPDPSLRPDHAVAP